MNIDLGGDHLKIVMQFRAVWFFDEDVNKIIEDD